MGDELLSVVRTIASAVLEGPDSSDEFQGSINANATAAGQNDLTIPSPDGEIPSSTRHTVLTGEAADARAAELAQTSWQPDESQRNDITELLSEYLDGNREGRDFPNDLRRDMEVVGTYGNIIVTAPSEGVTLTPEQQDAALADVVRSLEYAAQTEAGRRIVDEAQRGEMPLVIQVDPGSRKNDFTEPERGETVAWGDFSLIRWDPDAGVILPDGNQLPPVIPLLHELEHYNQSNRHREASLEDMSRREREAWPLGNAYFTDGGHPTYRDENGNSTRDGEDAAVRDADNPLAAELGLPIRGEYGPATYFQLDDPLPSDNNN